MRIAVTGTHGLIGRHLIPELERAGHRVVRLVRGRADDEGTVSWDPDRCLLDPADLRGVDAAVHLAGAGIFSRWNDSRKRAMLDSRVRGTLLLAERLAEIDPRPQVLVSGSAVGWYGDRGDELLTEQSPPGSGFLAELCAQWEAAAQAAVDAGIRTVFARTGIVQATDGGALATQLPIFKLGLGGRLGRGQQWTSWISIRDQVGAILHALQTDSLRGPVNLTAPTPVTNADYTRALGAALHRPALMLVPAPAIELALGREMAREMLLGGQRVQPAALESSGYRFDDPDLPGALGHLLG